MNSFDVIVVGAGHAGCEAAHAAAKMGSSVLLVTMNMETVAKMSCNPAMGGVAKGQIVREIDALGGMSGIVSDLSMIQFRMLNKSKGAAMWSPRAQSDRMLFSSLWRGYLEQNENVSFFQDMVSSLIIEGESVAGVKTKMGYEFRARSVVLTSGTFMNGVIHIGRKQFGGGRMSERASIGITEQLISLGFAHGRMKTGTPPRIDGRSLDWSKMEEQKGDSVPGKFSFTNTQPLTRQRSCYITFTNTSVHDILREGFDDSPMFNGSIQSLGPRYCPSIEDKINRFAHRDRHQVFVEPEGWDTVEVYVNGFSTSLPIEIQERAIKKIDGFERAKIFRPGYAIEYDYLPPTQLKTSLETKLISNLFFAGQINGTTGYEEAGSQGLLAGINAHLKLNEHEALVLDRSEAYIGVLIDDLVHKGTEEPYRMFTSRAEYRILLRQDNADSRLTPKGHSLGLCDADRLKVLETKQKSVKTLMSFVRSQSVDPKDINPILEGRNTPGVNQKHKLDKILTRPQVHINMLQSIPHLNQKLAPFSEEVKEQAEILVKYEGYIEKEKELVFKMNKLDHLKISPSFDYNSLTSLSSEAREKLTSLKPQNIGQASRISGVRPSDISILLVYFGR